jgi:hypothetical protein
MQCRASSARSRSRSCWCGGIDGNRDRLADEPLTLGQIEGDGRRSREFWNLIAAQSPGYCLRTRRSSSAVRGRCNRRCESCSASSINASRRATGISRRPSGQRSRRWGCCLGSVTVAHVSRATRAPSIGQLPYRLSPTSGSVDRVEEAVPADVLSPLPQERRTDTMTSWCPRREFRQPHIASSPSTAREDDVAVD